MTCRREMVPAEPFAGWLNERIEHYEQTMPFHSSIEGSVPATELLLREIGWTDDSGLKRLWRCRTLKKETTRGRDVRRGVMGKRVYVDAKEFDRRLVEEALHHAGVRLGELYPYEALVDEFSWEYEVPRTEARMLADHWIEQTWQSTWEREGLFVRPEDRPRKYCRSCRRTTAMFMGACDSCGKMHAAGRDRLRVAA